MVIMEVLGQQVPQALGQFTDRLLMMRYDDAVFSQIERPNDLPGYREPISR